MRVASRGFLAAIIAFSFSSCGDSGPGGDAPSGGESAHFDQVNAHLDKGGKFYTYMDMDGDMEALADTITDLLRTEGMPREFSRLNVKEIMEPLGLTKIKAIGLSSRDLGDRYFNRAFVSIPDGRTGMLKILGGEPGPFLANQIAPEDTDLIYERDIDLASGLEAIKDMLLAMDLGQGVDEINQVLAEGPPDGSFKLGDFISKGPSKITIIGRFKSNAFLSLPEGIQIPEPDLMIVMSGMAWVLSAMESTVPPGMIKKGDGVTSLEIPPSPPFNAYSPIVYVKEGDDNLYLASRQSYLDECLDANGAIASNPDYAKAMKGLPTEGNGLSYTSPDVNKIIMDVVDSMPDEMDQIAVVKKIYSMWLPEIEYGTARVSVNHSDGIATVSNTTGTHLSTIYSSYATPLAILASFAVPVFSKVTANANDAKNINNAKQLLTGCALYASDRGSGLYPESLDQLAEAGIIDAEYMARLIWQDPQTGTMEDWKYFEGLNNTQGSKILMASPRPVNGIRIVGMADGSSVIKMTEEEYQDRLSRQ